MAKHRSPNYPAHGLSEAVEMTRQIYAKEKRSQSSGEIVAKALGYSVLSGNARTKIASLKKYGLLEGDEKQGMRLTDLAMQLLYPSSGLEQSDALKKAALNPSLFRMLCEGKLGASDEAIVNYLVSKMDFSPSGAKQAVEAFRDTMSVSGLDASGYNEGDTPGQMEAPVMQTDTRSASSQQSAQVLTSTGPRSWTWPLSVPRGLNAQLTFSGAFTKADIARLKKQIEFLEDSFDDEETTQ